MSALVKYVSQIWQVQMSRLLFILLACLIVPQWTPGFLVPQKVKNMKKKEREDFYYFGFRKTPMRMYIELFSHNASWCCHKTRFLRRQRKVTASLISVTGVQHEFEIAFWTRFFKSALSWCKLIGGVDGEGRNYNWPGRLKLHLLKMPRDFGLREPYTGSIVNL